MRPERRTNKHKHSNHAAQSVHTKPQVNAAADEDHSTKYDMLRIHVGMLQNQIATMSLSIASMQAQIKKIEETIPPQKKSIPTIIPIEDIDNVSSDLHVDDGSDSEGYDTDDSPVQTHKVKTRELKSARQKFVFVPNYIEPPANDDSGYEDSD